MNNILKAYAIERSQQVLLSVLNELSGSIYLLGIDNSDFKVGAWTPLNINHDNVVVKYIARACTKNPDAPMKEFFYSYGAEVMWELGSAYAEFYAKDPVQAHNLAITIDREMTRFKTFLEILIQLEAEDDIEVLSKWLTTNPVEDGINDWR